MKVRLSSNEKLTLMSNLQTLISAGIPIMDAVELSLKGAKKGSAKVLAAMKEDLGQGKPMSQTLERFPEAFDPITVNLLKSAEEAGTLETILGNITENIKRERELGDKIKAALIYPTLVMIVFLGILVVILTYVIPRIAEVFSKLDVVIPLPTKVLIIISGFFMDNVVFVGVGFFVLLILLFLFLKFKKRLLVRIVSGLPLFSKVALDLDLARVANNLYWLLRSGIPIAQALELSEAVVTKRSVVKAIRGGGKAVVEGKELSVGLKKSKVIPEFVIYMVKAGEKSGKLEDVLQQLSERYENKVSAELKMLATIMEPLLLVVVAMVVGGMMLAIVAPIYQLISDMGVQ